MDQQINNFLDSAKTVQKIVSGLVEQIAGISLEKEKVDALRRLADATERTVAALAAAPSDPFEVVALMNEYEGGLVAIREYMDASFRRENLKTYVSSLTSNEFYKMQETFIHKLQSSCRDRNGIKKEYIDAVVMDAVTMKQLQESFRNRPLAYELYVALLQRIIAQHDNDPVGRAAIMEQIEKDKDWILGATFGKIRYTVNPPLYTHGLVPCSAAMRLPELAEALSLPKVKSLDALAKVISRADLIVQYRVIKNPIVYDITKLYGAKIDAAAGPNPKMIGLLKTLQYAAQEATSFKWRFDTEKWIDPANDRVLILNAVTPELFKVMAPIFSRRPILAFKSSVPFLYQDPVVSRRWMYNAQVIQRAMPRMFSSVKFDIKRIEQKYEIVDIKYLINRIYLELERKYDELSKGRPAATPSDLRNVFTNAAYTEIYSRICQEEFHNYFSKNLYLINIDKVDIGEVFSSFLFYLQHYERNFSKELYDRYNDLVKKAPDLGTMDKKVFMEIVLNALKKFIKNESNIYKNIHMKLYFQKLSIVE